MNNISQIIRNNLPLTENEFYNFFIKKCNRYLDGKPFDMNEIKGYIESCKDIYKPSSVGCIKAAIKNSLKNINPHNVLFLTSLNIAFKEIKTGRPDKKIYAEKILTSKEVKKLIKNLTPRLQLIALMLSTTGIRISELCNIKLIDCKIEKDIVYIQIVGKGNKQRRIFIPAELFENICNEFQSVKYLFETHFKNPFSRHYIWREIKRIGKKSLKRNISPHTFRHSFCTHVLIHKKKSLKAVSQYVGHSSTTVTADMYIHDELKPNDLF